MRGRWRVAQMDRMAVLVGRAAARQLPITQKIAFDRQQQQLLATFEKLGEMGQADLAMETEIALPSPEKTRLTIVKTPCWTGREACWKSRKSTWE